MTGAMRSPGGTEISPTGRSCDVDFCTVARWHDAEIVEGHRFGDLATCLPQIGLGG
jgi:hypothetical protein